MLKGPNNQHPRAQGQERWKAGIFSARKHRTEVLTLTVLLPRNGEHVLKKNKETPILLIVSQVGRSVTTSASCADTIIGRQQNQKRAKEIRP
jgi:hypothetical protein